jgi:transcriptional regulator with XRE-family HTH domain
MAQSDENFVTLDPEKIKHFRLSKGLSQSELADLIDSGDKTIARIESTKNYRTTIKTVYGLARVAGIDHKEFIKRFSVSNRSPSYLDRISAILDERTIELIERADTDSEVAQIVAARCQAVARGGMKLAARETPKK